MVLLAGALFIFGGPFDRQVLGRRDRLLKDWRPYGNGRSDVCVAEFAVVGRDGERTPVSHIGTLHDGKTWWQVSLGDRSLRSVDEVRVAGRQMCRALRVRDLRTRTKCGSTREGYRYRERWKDNLCR